MPLPIVAIVGRPNVGKSTLFNRLVGKCLALVDDRPGVTRDRREGDASLLGLEFRIVDTAGYAGGDPATLPGRRRAGWGGGASLLGLEFRIVDTAGYEDEDPETLPGRMRQQTEAAVRDADVALFLIDAREGLTPLDEEIGRWLRTGDTPVIAAANRGGGRGGEAGRREAFALGLGDPLAISAEHGEGVVDLFEALRPHVEREEGDEEGGTDEGGGGAGRKG